MKQVIITGKEYATFEEKESRNDISGQLEENSIISFYSRGGISAENIPLTYTHGVWNYTSELQWNTDQSDAVVSAYYPYMENDNFTVYEPDGKLKDILYYTGNTRYGSPIILKFSHLFSQLVFHVDPLLNKQLQEIQFTPSVSVHTFDPFSAEMEYTEEHPYPQVFTKQENGIYTLLVPPAPEIRVDISITTEEETYTASVHSSAFQSGYRYNYNIKSSNDGCGISTAEDFIAFTYLINGEAYGDRCLEEFGTSVNGKMTYYLLNDIHFTPEECARLQSIGHYNQSGFENSGFIDCLDGQNHTLYELKLEPKSNMDSYALFSFVDTAGIIKDLNIENVSYSNAGYTCKYEAIRTITGCHIKGNNSFTGESVKQAGGIAGINKGCVINCSAENIDFQLPNAQASGISFSNFGQLLNCYMASCDFTNTLSSGGICYTMEPRSEMKNCYTYKTIGYPSKKKYGSLVYKSNNCTIESGLYCDVDIRGVYDTYQTTPKQIYTYDENTMKAENDIPVIDILNNWISDMQTLPRTRWSKADETVSGEVPCTCRPTTTSCRTNKTASNILPKRPLLSYATENRGRSRRPTCVLWDVSSSLR